MTTSHVQGSGLGEEKYIFRASSRTPGVYNQSKACGGFGFQTCSHEYFVVDLRVTPESSEGDDFRDIFAGSMSHRWL